MMNDYDVIVAGGGIIGCSVAWQLSRREKRVLVVERRDVASGSAGATDGVVGYHTKKPGPQLNLAIESIDMFRTLGQELGEDIEYVAGAGGMEPVEDKEQWDILADIARQQSESGVDIHMISAEEACRLEPNLNPDIYGAMYSPTSGKINPMKLTMAYARAAKRLGAVILSNTRVTGFLIGDDGVEGVKTDKGEFSAGAVVDACGAWAGEIGKLAGLDLPIKPRRGQLAVTEPIGHFMTATMQCARYNIIKFHPETITDPAVIRLGSSLSIEQQEDGVIVIGGTREFAGYNNETTFEAVETMLKRAVRFFPALKDIHIVRTFAGLRPYTPDGLPLMGGVESLPHFYVAAGHEGDGIALSPITGKLIAELITEGKTSYDISLFSPDRFSDT